MSQRVRKQPTAHDLALWESVRGDLADYLYTGLAGRFQVAGHRLIDRWARAFADQVVLDIGCGPGYHLAYGSNHYRCYVGLDIEYRYIRTLRERFPATQVVNGDAYALPFRDQSADCVVSAYCFEHLRQLPECLEEIRRVLKPEGELLVALPAEGGLLYGMGRRLTSKPYMERKYGVDYEAIVRWEHWNTCMEIIEEISNIFLIGRLQYLPFFVPSVHFNVIAVLRAFTKQT